MATEIRVPTLGESVSEAIVGKWFKKSGDAVNVDEPLVELETDKVTVEVPAPISGVLGDIKVTEGQTVAVGALLGAISNGGAAVQAKAEKPAAPKPAPAPAAAKAVPATEKSDKGEMPPSPSARKKLAEAGIDAQEVTGSGKRGQILKEDVPAAEPKAPEPETPAPRAQQPASSPPMRGLAPVPVPMQQLRVPSAPNDAAREERVRMTRLRQTIAQRLKDKGITKVVFDRNGYLYHGRIQAVADAARKAGLEF